MAPRKKCPVCGSREWRKEPSSGLLVCSDGHILKDYRVEVNDANDGGQHTMRKRTIKSQRTVKERTSKADPKLYHGARAQFHLFQCLQLLLRKQVAALIKAWELPPEFETMCRDIWALHLSLLPSPPLPEPFLHEQDLGIGRARKADATPTPSEPGLQPRAAQADDEEPVREEPSSDSEDEPRPNSELDAILEGMGHSSGSSDASDEEIDELARVPAGGSASESRLLRRREGPASNIAVLVLACWHLRLPVIYMDFVRLIELHVIPYMEPLRALPEHMTRYLTKHAAQALTPAYAPTPRTLHRLSARLARKMHGVYAISTPEVNGAPLLWRVVRALGGTPVLYDLARRTARALDLPLTLDASLAPTLARSRARDPARRAADGVAPEVALGAAAAAVLKLVYGLDGRDRVPRDGRDPACAMPVWAEYSEVIEGGGRKEEEAYSARTQLGVAEMTGEEMDRYVGFLGQTLVGNDGACARALRAARVAEDGRGRGRAETRRPGEATIIYNAADVLGETASAYQKVVGRAASWAGVDTADVERTAEAYVRRLVRATEDDRRRRERESERGNVEDANVL
ncbi:hypothetical protein K488DRAFT_50812 [Vararia minispora EC-137]|uniref:Uncharacterized protein n=1 Tax=Vararia minispora EC-137 TaxID=1314806 RepID=A0ACB8QK48_9AGAM|nr:hypothetical protein K488DRAFT_50812 [Vararia minispora EC-137]